MSSHRIPVAALALVLFVGPMGSQCTKSPPELNITDAWMRPLLDNGAAFMVINNTGGRTDQLIGVQCNCAKTVTVHETRMDGNIMRMAAVGRLLIPGYASTELSPTGHHIMLEGIDRNIADGSSVKLILQFERSGSMEVMAEVRKL
ncbi:MAG: copper chaperone PCu(A)C [Myxococcota bacterium]